MAYFGFQFSEKYKIPVMIRITTRLAHSRSGVIRKEVLLENKLKLPENPTQFVLLPSIARKQYKDLLSKQNLLEKESENSNFNKYIDAKDKSMGIIACGLAYNYLIENYEDGNVPYPVLKIGQYPLPKTLVERMVNDCDSILVLEDGYPVVEELLKGYLGLGIHIKGRLDGTVPRDGELDPNIVAKALGIKEEIGKDKPQIVENRPPSFCSGCGHIDVYNAINEVVDKYGRGRVFADIGCYTLAALPPFDAINSCVDMGASVTMAKGASDAGLHPAVAVIGDSTFTHSGITGLLDAVVENTPMTLIISDNATTGMTGGQQSHAVGKVEDICQGIGVDPKHIRIITPLRKNHDENVKIMQEEFEYKGLSVIVSRRECIQTLKRKNAMKFAKK
jgi:indolepyruvate ferredoxin oxidoreductase, alpha subunit